MRNMHLVLVEEAGYLLCKEIKNRAFNQKCGMWKNSFVLLWILFSFVKEKRNDNSYNEESKAIQKHIQYILRIYYGFLCSSSTEENAEICSKREEKQAIRYEEEWDMNIQKQMEMIHRVIFLHICFQKFFCIFCLSQCVPPAQMGYEEQCRHWLPKGVLSKLMAW